MLALSNCYCGNYQVDVCVDKARATRFTRHGQNKADDVAFALGELNYAKFVKEVSEIDADSMETIKMFVKCYRAAYIYPYQ